MCDYYGCIYNSDGVCDYQNAAIKSPAARACNKTFDEEGAE